MKKFNYYNNELIFCGASHAICKTVINYDITVRGIIFDNEKIIYLRINDFSYANDLQAKKIAYQFKRNYEDCINYLKASYKGFKIYDSYTINNIHKDLKDLILAV